MSLPPLCNLFAAHHPDPAVLNSIEEKLRAGGEFAEVWRPAPGWIAAAAPLPDGLPDGEPVRENRLAFAEGRDRITAGLSGDPSGRFRQVAELVETAPERLASLPGDFGFIRFQPDGVATVVRSCGGLAPFYLRVTGDAVSISTRLGDHARYLREECSIDPLVAAVWASSIPSFPDRRTFLRGVSILDRGGYARLVPGRPICYGVYWDPRPERVEPPTPARALEHTQRLRRLLIQALETDLHPEDGNLLTLSGGVDSSVLAALACGVVGRKISTWSLLPGPEEIYQRQMAYIEPLAQRYGFVRRWEARFHNHDFLQAFVGAPDVLFMVMHPALCALPAVVREAPVRVLFGGEMADQMVGSITTIPDWVAETSPLRLVTQARELPLGTFRGIRTWIAHHVRAAIGRSRFLLPEELDPFVRPEVNEEYRVWWDARHREFLRDRRPHRPSATLCTLWDGVVAMNWAAPTALGVRRSLPFFTREVQELGFECHPEELIGPGTKKLLRTALRGDVPEQNLQRPDKGFWRLSPNKQLQEWDTSLPEALAEVVRAEDYARQPGPLPLETVRAFIRLECLYTALATRRAL